MGIMLDVTMSSDTKMQCFLLRNTDTRMFFICENALTNLFYNKIKSVKVAADIIAEPLTYTFNFTAGLNTVPKVRKSAFVIPRQ